MQQSPAFFAPDDPRVVAIETRADRRPGSAFVGFMDPGTSSMLVTAKHCLSEGDPTSPMPLPLAWSTPGDVAIAGSGPSATDWSHPGFRIVADARQYDSLWLPAGPIGDLRLERVELLASTGERPGAHVVQCSVDIEESWSGRPILASLGESEFVAVGVVDIGYRPTDTNDQADSACRGLGEFVDFEAALVRR